MNVDARRTVLRVETTPMDLGDLQPRDEVKRPPRAYDAAGRSRELRARVDNILDFIRQYAPLPGAIPRRKVISRISSQFGRSRRTVRDDLLAALEDPRVQDNGDGTVSWVGDAS